MNEKGKIEKTTMKNQERLFNENIENRALDQFVKEPKKSNLYDKVVTTINSVLLFLLFGVICIASAISTIEGTMEFYVTLPIIFLSMIGISILIKRIKKE